nr:DUF4197 family protein [Nitrospiraceae bacterium]
MKKAFFLTILVLLSSAMLLRAGMLEDVMKHVGGSTKGPDESTTASGLKEALSIGTENAVKSVSRPDGYFGNQTIKILMPEKIRN